ncbi:MAG: Uma2 family endonuclease [Gemmataceae bacterium]
MKSRFYLTPRDAGRKLSLKEFMASDSREGYLYELINGRLEVWPLPEMPHDFVRCWLRDELDDYAKCHPEAINEVYGPAHVFVPNRRATTAPEPDVAAYRDFPHHIHFSQLHWQDVSPTVVAEILWEDTAAKDLVRNRDLYLQVSSIREYWIIDPRNDAEQPSLIVYRRRGQRWQLPIEVAGGDTYTTRLLPDFQLILTVIVR